MAQYSTCITRSKLRIKDKCQDWHNELVDNAQNVQLNADVRMELFRNVRELLTNVHKHKHAHAKKVSVSLDCTKDSLKITVQDDGVGFDSRIALKYDGDDQRFGLFSIRIV